MIALAFSAAPAFTPPTNSRVMGRRDALLAGLGAGAALSLSPAPAFAQRSSLIPKSSKESTESFKQYKLSSAKYAPGQESEAFKQAQALREKNAAVVANRPNKEESAEETMRRLGMKSYSDSLASGKPDPCGAGSFACGRR